MTEDVVVPAGLHRGDFHALLEGGDLIFLFTLAVAHLALSRWQSNVAWIRHQR